MSALPPKADMCGALPSCPLCADSGHWQPHSITSSARAKASAVLRPSNSDVHLGGEGVADE